MINRGDIKLAIDMVVNAQDDELFGGEAEYVINTLEDCGNTIAAQAAVIESLKSMLDQLWNGCENLHDNALDEYDKGYTRAMADSCKEALALPTDSTQILAEVRRAEREKVIEKCIELGAIERDGVFAEEIRAME